jgi:hypothetical protein
MFPHFIHGKRLPARFDLRGNLLKLGDPLGREEIVEADRIIVHNHVRDIRVDAGASFIRRAALRGRANTFSSS